MNERDLIAAARQGGPRINTWLGFEWHENTQLMTPRRAKGKAGGRRYRRTRR